MSYYKTCLRHEPLQLLGNYLNTLHAVMHKEYLPSPVYFAQYRFTDQAFVVFSNGGANRQPLLWRRLDYAHIAQVDQGHMQRAGNGRGRHGQDIDLTAQLLESLFMYHSKTLLFIDDQETKIEEDHIFLQQAMGTDDNIDLPKCQVFEYLLLFLLRTETAEQLNANREGLQPLLKRVEVLEGQYGGRYKNS